MTESHHEIGNLGLYKNSHPTVKSEEDNGNAEWFSSFKSKTTTAHEEQSL